MRWFSTKKYKPSDFMMDLIIRTIKGHLYIAHCHDMETDGSYQWELQNDEIISALQVTHFCVPDPVEIEE